jgi:uncharacterized membrane protein YdfJ with MMPL/SSD domain
VVTGGDRRLRAARARGADGEAGGQSVAELVEEQPDRRPTRQRPVQRRLVALGAVATGLAATARVITAAAAIMVVVFASFVPSVNLTLKLIGVGLATAIATDATVVRMLLVPAIMRLHGRYAWWLPDHLGRLLPRIRLEGASPGAAGAVVS